MNTSFIYNGKLYNPKNLDKKLKQLGITIDDVELCDNPYKKVKEQNEQPDPNNPTLYRFINKKNGYTLLSIHPTLEKIKENDIGNTEWLNDYETAGIV